jgi:DNA-formamidopyrimidine glycosylase
MPEGVEVKLSADIIKPLLVNKYIVNATVDNTSRYKTNPPEGMEEFLSSFRKLTEVGWMVDPCIITDVNVKGKFMYWTFSNGWYMLNTFGMTGQWSPQPGKHVCLKFRLYDVDPSSPPLYMYFNDPRHFGTIKFTNNKKDLTDKIKELGWDPLAGNLDQNLKWLSYTLSKTKKPIGQVLMDQSVFAGVGNYIRAEALYKAGMSPWRQSNLLKKEEVELLAKAIVEVMQESYTHQGATILTYKDAYGAEGKYSSCFKVYNQKTDPNGHIIIRQDTPEGRTIHWCPNMQK